MNKLFHRIAFTVLLINSTIVSAQFWSAFPCNNFTGSVSELSSNSTTLYLGGYFPDKIANYTIANGCQGGFPDPNLQIRSMALYNGDLYVSGLVLPPDTTKIYRLSQNGWTVVAAEVGAIIDVLHVYNNELYAGGYFLQLNGNPYNHIARYNGSTWSDAGGGIWPANPLSGAHVRSMTVHNNKLYVGGDSFSPFANNIASWDGNTWSSLGTGIGSNGIGTVFSLASYGGDLYAGGQFNLAGAVNVSNIAKWNGSTWSGAGNGVSGADSLVATLCVYNNLLYAGGSFTNPANSIAAFNGSTWSDVSGGVSNGNVLSLTPYLGSLIVGGFFSQAGGITANNLAKFSACPVSITASGSTTFCSGNSVTLTSSTGTAYQWRLNGNNIVGGTNQSLTVTTAGTYSCLTTTACGLVLSNNLIVSVTPTPAAVITANGPTSFCAGDSVILSSNTAGGYSYQWYKYGNPIIGANTSAYIAKTTGSYKVRVQNNLGCAKKSAALQVTVNPLPTASIAASGSTSICAGDSVMLTVTTNTPGSTFQWKKYANFINGANAAVYAAKTTGSYKAVVTSPAGCVRASNKITVTVVCREASSDQPSWEVFPNPAEGEVYIRANSQAVIEIYDITGALKWRDIMNDGETEKLLNIEFLPAGVYVVMMKSGMEMKVVRLVKV